MRRNTTDKELVSIKLFDVIDKQKHWNDEKIQQAFPLLKANTLSNHKSRLYEQILVSLKLLQSDDPGIRIKDHISYAELLQRKGFYLQSLAQLSKAKLIATTFKMDILRLEIVEFEKKIESRYVTRSHSQRAKELTDESSLLRSKFYFEGAWSDLSLKLYDYYLKFGHSKSEGQQKKLSAMFKESLPTLSDAGFEDTIYKYQCYVWFYYISQDFSRCYGYAQKWCQVYEKNEVLIESEPEMYIRGLHNVLSALFYCDDVNRFIENHKKLKAFTTKHQHRFNENQLIQSFIYTETANLNSYIVEGRFTEGARYSDEFLEKMKQFEGRLDIHRIMVFHYKIASLKFGSADFSGAVKHLNIIINHPNISLKEDIQCFARILNLISHYELGNDDLIDFQIKSTYRFLLKLSDYHRVHSAIFNFLKNSVFMDRKMLIQDFKILREELLDILEDKYERRSLLYLDLISWLESKIYSKPVEEIIQEKKLAKRR
ncbi:hypothetical protein [Ekhidna lutea]|uniref:hypothetical protein n=1 Tax=Ekhidna lutea TaxID=447679 RepID=UPI00117E5630|nr:hypothetical protein [Ekhidna lutea]